MAFAPDLLTPEMIEFGTVRHLATLTTLRADGSPHVAPVGFTYDPATQRVRIITGATNQKARNAERGSVGLVCQVDGGRYDGACREPSGKRPPLRSALRTPAAPAGLGVARDRRDPLLRTGLMLG